MMRVKATTLVAMIAVVAAACSSATASDPMGSSPPASVAQAPSASISDSSSPGPTSPAPTPTASPSSVLSPSPVPTPPPDLDRRVVDEFDDIRIEIELQRNPLPATEASWIKVTVTNEGPDDVTWFHDGCALLAFVHGTATTAWQMGIEQVDQAAKFKTYVLGGHIVAEPSAFASLSFVPESRLGKGSYGCADVGMADTIAPGRSKEQTLWWSGFTDLHQGPPPGGPATIFAYGAYYSRGTSPGPGAGHVFELEIDTWITGDDATARLSPAQVVDAALADPAFATYLATQSIANGRAVIAWYDDDRDLWEVGVMPWHETTPPRIHGVLVDAVTGAIIGPLDRDWDQDVDLFP